MGADWAPPGVGEYNTHHVGAIDDSGPSDDRKIDSKRPYSLLAAQAYRIRF